MELQKINFINNIPVKNHHFHEPQDKNKYGFKLFMTSAFIGPPRSGKIIMRKKEIITCECGATLKRGNC